jgi:hypothetical protein
MEISMGIIIVAADENNVYVVGDPSLGVPVKFKTVHEALLFLFTFCIHVAVSLVNMKNDTTVKKDDLFITCPYTGRGIFSHN